MTLKHKIVTLRKPRRCFTCREPHGIGGKMVYHVGIYEGDFGAQYYCVCCDEYIERHMECGDTWGEGDFRGEEHYETFKKEWNDKIKLGSLCS